VEKVWKYGKIRDREISTNKAVAATKIVVKPWKLKQKSCEEMLEIGK